MFIFLVVLLIVVVIGSVLVLMLKPDHVPETERTAEAVKFRFDHWLPKLIRMGSITIGHTIFTKYLQSEIRPWTDRGWRNHLRHEFHHVDQYESRGMVDYILGYIGLSIGAAIRDRKWSSLYQRNQMELDAVANEGKPFTDRQHRIVERYWPLK